MCFFKFFKQKDVRKNTDDSTIIEQHTELKRKTNLNSPLMEFTETELRDLCRHHIDIFEKWSRRIIDEKFKESYGSDYFNYEMSKGQPLVRNEIKKRIEQRVRANPERFPRKIDAVLLEDIEYFFCRDDLYNSQFKKILEPFYSGIPEIRKTFDRLIPIRNKLSHGNTISIHEAEQCICYTGDFINVYKQYYINVGKEKDYNVPVFLRIKDNFGNDIIRENSQAMWELYFYGASTPKIQLRSGDSYKLWVEVDSSFDETFYDITWVVKQDYLTVIKKGTGNIIEFTLNNKSVSYAPTILISLITKRDWHRFHNDDDTIWLHYDKVLPPIEETY